MPNWVWICISLMLMMVNIFHLLIGHYTFSWRDACSNPKPIVKLCYLCLYYEVVGSRALLPSFLPFPQTLHAHRCTHTGACTEVHTRPQGQPEALGVSSPLWIGEANTAPRTASTARPGPPSPVSTDGEQAQLYLKQPGSQRGRKGSQSPPHI